MHFIPQVLFVLISGLAVWLFAKNIVQIKKNILLGKEEDLSDHAS